MKAGEKLIGSTAAQTSRKPEPESNSTVGSTWRLGWGPVEGTFLLLGGRQDPKQQVLDTVKSVHAKEEDHSSVLQDRCACTPFSGRKDPTSISVHLVPFRQAHQKYLFLHEVFQHEVCATLHHQITPNGRTFYKINDYSSSSKVSRS